MGKLKSGIKSLPVTLTHIAKVGAPILGVLTGFLTDPMAEGRGVAGIAPFLVDRAKHFKLMNPIETTQHALRLGDEFYPIMSSATMLIIGLAGNEVLNEIGDIPQKQAFKNITGAIAGYGGAALVSTLIAAWLYLTTWNPPAPSTATTSGRVSAPIGSFQTATPSTGAYLAPML